MKKVVSLFIFSFIFVLFASADVEKFILQTNKTSVDLNDAVDFTVTAIDSQGTIQKDFEGPVLMIVENDIGSTISDQDVVLPEGGMFSFKKSNQGILTFSKSLLFRKPGNYTIYVNLLDDETIKGEMQITAKGEIVGAVSGSVTIISPLNGSIEMATSVNINGKTDLPNSNFDVYVDGQKVLQSQKVDADGNVSVIIDDLKDGSHALKIKITGVEDKILAESQEVKFDVIGEKNGINTQNLDNGSGNVVGTGNLSLTGSLGTGEFQSGSIMSGGSLTGDMIGTGLQNLTGTISWGFASGDIFSAYSSTTGSVILNGKSVRDLNGILVKSYKILYSDKEISKKTDISSLSVKSFKFNDLSGDIISLELRGLKPANNYYGYVVPVNKDDIEGTKTSVFNFQTNQEEIEDIPVSFDCQLSGSKIKMLIEEGKTYLSWDYINGIDKYDIYMSTTKMDSIAGMTKIGETKETIFDISKYQSSGNVYYSVQALCDESKNIKIDNSKKTKISIFDAVAMVILFVIMIYGSFKIYRYSQN